MNKKQTTMKVVCAWCNADLGTKDGQGTTGTTHGICKRCAKKFKAATPARWNLVGRWLARRRNRAAFVARLEAEHAQLIEFDRQANEREELRQAFEGNPTLQSWAVLHGKLGVHWIDVKDVVELQGRVIDQFEIKCRWN